VRIGANGYRSYVVRGRIHGRLEAPIRVTIGPCNLYSLSEAREKAREVLRQLHDGKDPREEKRAVAASYERQKKLAFNLVAESYIREHVGELRTARRAAGDIRRLLVAEWGNRPADSITADDVADIIRGLVAQGHVAMAERILASIKSLFRWASSPARPRDERLERNPAADLRPRDVYAKPEPRDRKLSADELRAIWTAAGQLEEPGGSYVHMLMRSGQRRGEVAGMAWSELDLDGEGVWIIPARRMKAGRDHEVPLTSQMLELLRAMPQTSPLVFPGAVSNYAGIKNRLTVLMPPAEQWGLHDLRRAMRTGLGAIPSIPHDVAELVVGHLPPALTRTYSLQGYSDEKRQALELWGSRVARIVEPPTGEVVELRRAK